MIEKLIELDFDEPALQKTNILLNQASSDSIIFRFRVYKNATEVDYNDFIRAELVFRKQNGQNVIDDGNIGISGITYALRNELLDTVGTVLGYVTLISITGIEATLHYSFSVVSDLIDFENVRNSYIKRIEDFIEEIKNAASMEAILQIVDEINRIVAEAREILEGLQSDAFVSVEQFNEKIGELNELINNINAENISVNPDGMLLINKNPQDGLLTPMIKENFVAVTAQMDHIAQENLLINGSLQVWQRGDTFTNPNRLYTADRMLCNGTGIVTKHANGMQITGNINLRYIMEAADFKAISGKTVTLSYSKDGVTQPPLTYNAATARVVDINLTAGIYNWFKLENGDKNTPYKSRLISNEIALCQRYYIRYGDRSGNYFFSLCQMSSNIYAVAIFPYFSQLSTIPTLQSSNFVSNNFSLLIGATLIEISGIANLQPNDSFAHVTFTASGLTIGQAGRIFFQNNAWLAYDAEVQDVGVYNIHYVRLDESGSVAYGFSDAFEESQPGDILITDRGGRHFEIDGEINPTMSDYAGAYLYKHENGRVVKNKD